MDISSSEDSTPLMAKAVSKPNVDVASSSRLDGLSAQDQSYAEAVLTIICSLPAAHPFLRPVDPVRENAPNYFHVIQKPMDLGTVEKRLKSHKYPSTRKKFQRYPNLQSFVDEVNLVFDNCFKYNGTLHNVSQLAIQVKTVFEEKMADAPSGKGLKFSSVPKPTAAPINEKQNTVPSDRMTHASAKHHSPNAPRRRGLPGGPLAPASVSRGRRDPIRIAQDKFCKAVLDHLYQPQYETMAFPFLRPVDPDLYPDYFSQISRPMDLSTVQDKLSHGAYGSAGDFRDDVKLMFANCYQYNPSWATVWKLGRQLEEIFDAKWKELPGGDQEVPSRPSTSATPQLTPQQKKAAKSANTTPRTPQRKPLTEEQKLALCDTLVTLSDTKMNKVIELIRKRMPQFRENKEQLSLEFENIPPLIQAEMYEFINGQLKTQETVSLFDTDQSSLSEDDNEASSDSD
ncbi:Bromodomain-containing protein [Serendipita vermifera]|nr:Bromodomain-containing protein [Serendipita vermifera]